MRYFYDTEFIEDGHTIELISIGVVAEDGREYYAVSTEFDPERAGSWVRTHVLPKLPPPASQLWRSRQQIRLDLEEFLRIDGTDSIELWAWVGAYDHVALCQLWGPMTALPPTVPRFTRELRQLWETGDAPGCRRGHATSTTRWSMPEISCAGFVSSRPQTMRAAARPAEETDSQIPPARTSERTSP